jgi:hypothetical protein
VSLPRSFLRSQAQKASHPAGLLEQGECVEGGGLSGKRQPFEMAYDTNCLSLRSSWKLKDFQDFHSFTAESIKMPFSGRIIVHGQVKWNSIKQLRKITLILHIFF